MVLEFLIVIPGAASSTSFKQAVKIALLDSGHKFLPFVMSIGKDGAAAFPGIRYQDCLSIGRYLDARPSVTVECGVPGEASAAPPIYHDVIS
jgi:hypothetical protein